MRSFSHQKLIKYISFFKILSLNCSVASFIIILFKIFETAQMSQSVSIQRQQVQMKVQIKSKECRPSIWNEIGSPKSTATLKSYGIKRPRRFSKCKTSKALIVGSPNNQVPENEKNIEQPEEQNLTPNLSIVNKSQPEIILSSDNI